MLPQLLVVGRRAARAVTDEPLRGPAAHVILVMVKRHEARLLRSTAVAAAARLSLLLLLRATTRTGGPLRRQHAATSSPRPTVGRRIIVRAVLEALAKSAMGGLHVAHKARVDRRAEAVRPLQCRRGRAEPGSRGRGATATRDWSLLLLLLQRLQ